MANYLKLRLNCKFVDARYVILIMYDNMCFILAKMLNSFERTVVKIANKRANKIASEKVSRNLGQFSLSKSQW